MSGYKTVDTHSHIDEIENLEEALEEAASSGVIGIVGVGMTLEGNRFILEKASQHENFVLPAIGLHPWYLSNADYEACLSFIRENLKRCVALGEVGLDYKTKTTKALQQEVFQRLLDIASEFEKPVIVHARYSHKRCYEMILKNGIKKAVFHWYSGPLDILEKIVADGYFVSATPALTYSQQHRVCIKEAALENILVETDSPVEYQGLVSRPVHIHKTLQELAKLKEMDITQVAEKTLKNAENFLGIKFAGVR